MTAQEIQKRNQRAQKLKVIQVDDGAYYVESSEGKICYKVSLDDGTPSCTCGDFARNSRTDPTFTCKHIVAVLDCIPKGDVEEAQYLEKKRPKLDERFIIEIEGNEYVKYSGLLDLAHQAGILKIEVDPIQLPTKENGNFAICKATVVSKTGETYIDVGDANPENCTKRVVKHLLRMASTRSIARALRSFTNIGMTCLEELADLNDVIGDESPKTGTKIRKAAPKKEEGKETKVASKPDAKDKGKPKDKATEPPKTKSKEEAPQTESGQDDQTVIPRMSEAQKRAIYNLSRRRNISVEECEKMVQESYQTSLENLSSKDASAFIRTLQQAA
jgi:hypothetical protein